MRHYRKQRVENMSKKIPLGIAIAVILAAIAVSSVITGNIIVKHHNELLVELPQRAQQYSSLADVEELVRREYFGEIDSSRIDESIANGFLNGLGDSFCYYIAPEDFETYSNLIKGRMPGLGINAYYESSTDNLIVSSVEENSPASSTDIKKDTQIVSVNGKNVTEDNYKDIISLISDSFEEQVKIEYYNISSEENKDAQKQENKKTELSSGYTASSCFSSIDGSYGYVRITDFYENTLQEFKDIMKSFADGSVTSVVLDLRNSSGADLDVAAGIIDTIVPVGNEGTGAIYTAKNASGDIVSQASSDSAALSFEFAVLVNDRTECAAELIACDLRDFGKAVIIGETTSGHGSLQKLFRLENGAAVTLTVAEIIPYTSDSFDESGVVPDIDVEISDSMKNKIGDIPLSDDTQYQAALSYLKSK